MDGHHLGPFTLPDKSYWSLTISNIPRPGDTCVANPGWQFLFDLCIVASCVG